MTSHSDGFPGSTKANKGPCPPGAPELTGQVGEQEQFAIKLGLRPEPTELVTTSMDRAKSVTDKQLLAKGKGKTEEEVEGRLRKGKSRGKQDSVRRCAK